MNYPVKYAVLVLEQDDLNSDVKYYIVSKCYVLENTIRYFEESEKKTLYKVIFPYPKMTDDFSKRVEPSFNENGDPRFCELVNILFDNFSKAKEYATLKNNNVNLKLVSEVSLERDDWQEEIDRVQKEHGKGLNKCYDFEEKLMNATSDMKITDLPMKLTKE